MASDTRARILDLFHRAADGCLSGEAICHELGVSRTAVWKHIRALREQGYRVEGVASRGYRLLREPDRLLPEALRAGLETVLVGTALEVLERTESTNTVAQQRAEAGAAEGLVVLAETQTAGRGRLGRSWASPPGVNLYLSVLLRPAIAPQQAALLTFVGAVAVAQALEEVCGVTPAIKWPNDLLLDGRKVAGLLTEMRAETDRVHHVVLGIGLNLNMTAEQFPPDLRYPATSVRLETGRKVARPAVAQALLRRLDGLYREFLRQGPAAMLAEWDRRCAFRGQVVRVSGGSEAQGRLLGADTDGALLLETAAGRQRILSGDLRPVNGF